MHACIPTFGTKLTPKKFFFDKDQIVWIMHHTCEEAQNKKYLEEIDPTSIEYDFSFQRPKVLFCHKMKWNWTEIGIKSLLFLMTLFL